jgi:hypothetical protein
MVDTVVEADSHAPGDRDVLNSVEINPPDVVGSAAVVALYAYG